ncbi:thyrotroph embryonic factor-like [Acropora millepora]|uniref:thyrotroph embryonic factor-like n=1 Tax=Acropora millepora TaxID=45264 RepID=UPI001CF5E354|nr:thyrotroph embryonic factor-like [Acropora millepora]
MSVNFLKNYMDLDEFLAVKDLCAGLSRTESDYSEDDVDQDHFNFIDEEDVSPGYDLSPHFDANNSSLASPGSGSTSDEGRGDSVCSSENTVPSASESPNPPDRNDDDKAPRKRKRKSASQCADKETTPTRKRRRKGGNDARRGSTRGIIDDPAPDQTTAAPILRIARKSVDGTEKDDKYWERRRKNNQAAKRSRDLKRQKEIDVKEKAANLEEENRQLREEVKRLKDYLKSLGDKVD